MVGTQERQAEAEEEPVSRDAFRLGGMGFEVVEGGGSRSGRNPRTQSALQ